MYTIHGFNVKNSLEDMTVKEFEKISMILQDPELEQLERYITMLEYLGMPDEIINRLTDDELFDVIGSFTAKEYEDFLIPEVEIGGYRYVAYEGEGFKLYARDLLLIEKAIKKSPNYMSTIIGIVFKRDDLTTTEHFANAHIVHKASLFGELNAAQMYPYLVHITSTVNQKIKKHIDTATSAPELIATTDTDFTA